jgi:aquaporin Z
MPRSESYHPVEYAIEALLLGAFMVSAALFATLIEHPGSPVRAAIDDPLARRVLMGLAMGSTAIAMIYSPWGRRSGAHFNPAVTLTFAVLGKIRPLDAAGYIAAQFAGGIAGLALAAAVLGELLAAPDVRFVTTVPGDAGRAAAFAAEVVISFGMMLTVLLSSNAPRFAPFTGLFAGALVATWITFEAPLSGMSMNPARTLASAVPSRVADALWVYFTAPPLGMLLAAGLFRVFRPARAVICAKLRHDTVSRCIFRCGYHVPSADERAVY